MKLCWVDIRTTEQAARAAILEEAVHQRIDGVLSDDAADLGGLPPTVKKVLLVSGDNLPEDLSSVDIVLLDEAGRRAVTAGDRRGHPGVAFGRFVEIIDAETL